MARPRGWTKKNQKEAGCRTRPFEGTTFVGSPHNSARRTMKSNLTHFGKTRKSKRAQKLTFASNKKRIPPRNC